MWLWLILGVGLVALVVYRGTRRVGAVPILRADIGTSDGRRFEVAYHIQHQEMAPVEYVRLILHFAAKMLYNLDPKDELTTQETEAFLRTIRLLAERGVARDTNVGALIGSPLSVEEVASVDCDKTVRATLGFVNPMIRSIHTSIPLRWIEYQFLHSWIALIHTSLPKLDAVLVERLNGSLMRLNVLYELDGVDPKTLAGLREAPNDAFLDAVVTSNEARRPLGLDKEGP